MGAARRGAADRHGRDLHLHDHRRLYLIHIAGDELQLGIAIGRAAGVGKGDPALELDGALVGRELGDVIGAPAEAAGQIGELDRNPALHRAVELSHQSGTGAEIGRHLGEDDAARHIGLDAVADLQHHAVGHAQHLGFLHHLVAAVGIDADDPHHAADGFLEKLLRRQQVEVEVLLQHVEGPGARFEQRRLGPDLAADIDEGDVVLALHQVDRARIAHQRQILVVDGDRDAGLVRQGDIGFTRQGGGRHGQGQESGGGTEQGPPRGYGTAHGSSPLEMWYWSLIGRLNPARNFVVNPGAF